MTDIHLEGETLEAVFSRENGALIRLTSKRTGWNIQKPGELGLSFKMLVPLPDRRNNQVVGEKQTLAGWNADSDGKEARRHVGWPPKRTLRLSGHRLRGERDTHRQRSDV